jgi:hypothetical protein
MGPVNLEDGLIGAGARSGFAAPDKKPLLSRPNGLDFYRRVRLSVSGEVSVTADVRGEKVVIVPSAAESTKRHLLDVRARRVSEAAWLLRRSIP